MRFSAALVTVLGLGRAMAQEDAERDKLADLVKQDISANFNRTLDLLKDRNKFSASSVTDLAKLFGWQVSGSLDGDILKLDKVTVNIGQAATIGGMLVNGDYNMAADALKDWAKNFGTTALAFLPKVGALGNLPGFLTMLVSIAGTIDGHYHASTYAGREAEAACFSNESQTYKGLCDNCSPNLVISLLGKLHNCSDEKVALRDGPRDLDTAQQLCSTVLCSTYASGAPGGRDAILSNPYRYDPLRSFWCMTKEKQIGLLLNPTIGAALSENLGVIDYHEFRNKLVDPCKKLYGGGSENKCPTNDVFQKKNQQFPPVEYCAPGLRAAPLPRYVQDPKNSSLFTDESTWMQYKKNDNRTSTWTGKCGSYRESSDGLLNHGCCGPFDFPTGHFIVKPEDGAPWCQGVRDENLKVPDNEKMIPTPDNIQGYRVGRPDEDWL
ncbi:class iii nucleotidyl cyclase [Fusarium langsethiae]|uniref:Class iii nucleotidyl cyclase n=1 Tax=Fusarium langsethiae TaxID=179993 RepID=A0A0M9EMQ2_FUSLA|nr:class iii nucleotidyl cyclase [Fusarium langsethiae]GKU09491.1 unnamed protein product [Fusarium langsethiae]